MANLSTVTGVLKVESLTKKEITEEEIKEMRKKIEEYFLHCFGTDDWELWLTGEWFDRYKYRIFSIDPLPDERDPFLGRIGFETTGRWSFSNNLKWLIHIDNLKKLKELELDNFRITFKFDEYEVGCNFIIIGDECIFEVKDGEPSLVIVSETNGENTVKSFDFDLICKSHYIEICDLMEEINSFFDPYEIFRTGAFLLSKKELKWKIINLYKYIGKYIIKDMDENTNLNESPEVQKMLRLARVELGILEEVLKEYQ